MHELSLSSHIVDTAVKHAAGRPVKTVRLRVGALRQVVPDTLAFYFGFVAKGTVCEGAHLEQTVLPARLRCSGCEREWELDVVDFRCTSCRIATVAVIGGNELEVESIDVEEDACISNG